MTDGTVKLLIIEDDKIDQLAYQRFLRESNLKYKVDFADSIQSAKELISKHEFDVALIDYLLRDGTAFDVLDIIGEIPGIIVTGAGDTDIAVSAMKSGAIDYLVKDPDGNFLKAIPTVVQHALEYRRQKKELQRYREKLEELVRERTEELEKEIQERKKTEQALFEKNSQYQTFVDNAVVGIYRLDFKKPVYTDQPSDKIAECIIENGFINECNDALALMYGRKSKEEFIGTLLKDLSIDKNISKERLIDFVENGFKTLLLDNEEYDINKNIKYFRNSYSGFVSEGKLKWIWGIQTDITERKQVEKLQQVLYDIVNETFISPDMETLFTKIQLHIDKVVNASNFFIALLDEGEKLKIVYSTADEHIDFDLTGKKSLTGYVINHKKPFLLKSNDIEELYKKGEVELLGRPAEAWMGIPLIIGDSTIGAIVVQSYDNPEKFTQKHLDFLTFISNQVALLIEKKVKDEQIRTSLKEKEVLLKEVHHRVKNNLQIISSLLSLQSKKIKKTEYFELFQETQQRVRSISLVHEKLYSTEDFSKIDFGDYISTLSRELLRVYSVDPGKIKLNIDVKEVELDVATAVPCGLVLNELISNSLKHAFPEKKSQGEIKIEMTKNDNKIYLIVEDNGVGLPENINLEKTDSLGLRLVTILIKDQLQGNLNVENKKGVKFILDFPIYLT